MNQVAKWLHINQKTNVKNGINPVRRGLEGVSSALLYNGEQNMNSRLRKEGILPGCVSDTQVYSGTGPKHFLGIRSFSKCIFESFSLGQLLVSPNFAISHHGSILHPFAQPIRENHTLSREWLVQLWLEENKRKKLKHKRQHKHIRHTSTEHTLSQTPFSSFRPLFNKLPASVYPGPEAQPVGSKGPSAHQLPPTQSLDGELKPTCPEEVKIAPLLARANLLITRDVEWANLMFGFEQENRYAIVDPSYSQSPVGFILEKSNIFMRQLLRTRRPFVALMTDAMGNELFRVRRPPWLINSTIYVYINDEEIGVVHRRWHLWRRIYDLYLGKKQFAVVENAGFWDWTFTLKDENGNTLAEIDRDWRGFGFEMFTDAGQYVIRFGDIDSSAKAGPAAQIQELNVTRPLTLLERAVTVALAVSLDNDYFSRHSGWGIPIFPYWGGE